ncbi:MAG: glycosyltransferase [Burkholderiales bacterium]|nr:glycosyltransferase [Burkholderiales bacterium]
MARELISIVVKTFNEERNISRAIRSIHAAAAGHTVEVIVADSLSTDATVRIATELGAKVVQLKHPADRSCGVGAQLGFLEAAGDYVFILDGDMELEAGFLDAAVEAFRHDPRLGGVAGQVTEMSQENRVFVNRMKHNSALTAVGPVDRLDGGGIYRAQALRDVRYLTHRGLHSCEELELGCRLQARGWSLVRLACPGVRHWGHTLPRYPLLFRRMRSQYVLGPGEFIRASLGKPWFGRAVRAYRAYLAMIVLWLCIAGGLLLLPLSPWPLAIGLLALLALFGRTAIKRRHVGDAAYALVAWNVFAWGLLRGFLRTPKDPASHIDRVVLAGR